MKLGFLKEKKYGLPVWAWGLIVAGLIFGLYYLRKKNAGSSTANNNPADPNATNPSDFGSAGPLETPWDYQSAPFDIGTTPSTSGSTPDGPTPASTTTPTTPNSTSSPPAVPNTASRTTSSALAQVLSQPVGTAIPIVTQQQAALAIPGGVVGGQSKLVGAGGKNTL